VTARPTGRRIVRGLAAFVLVLAVALVVENVLLNLFLPLVLNLRPERLRIDYSLAWTVIPGSVEVRNLRVRNQGQADQWLVQADRASGSIDLQSLRHERFQATEVRAEGVSVRYRRRLDVDPPVTAPAVDRLEISFAPPIEGLLNPPEPPPDPARRGRPWEVILEDVQVSQLDEIWIGSYRLVGRASTVANVRLAGSTADLEATLTLQEMRADVGDSTMADAIHGQAWVLVDALDRGTLGLEKLRAISARAQVETDIQDLQFLDFYLVAAPWFSLDGTGHVAADVVIEEGELRPGTVLKADFPDLLARVVSNDVTGDGTLRASVDLVEGEPEARLELAFDDFAITRQSGTQRLAEGHGFHASLVSPDVHLDRPLTLLDVALELPESRIPDVEAYNAFLPKRVGLGLLGGTGLVHGKLTASTIEDQAHGELVVTGDELVVGIDRIRVTADLALHARMDADLTEGRYDVSGSTMDLRHVGIVDPANPAPEDGQRLWSAHMAAPSGTVQVGAPVYLDTALRLTCSSSDPFVTIFASKKSLPRWAQALLTVPDLSGEARLRLGAEMLSLDRCSIRGGPASVDLRFTREGPSRSGDLYATYGALSLGVELRDDKSQLKLVGARRWFDGVAEGGTIVAANELDEEDATKDLRAESRPAQRKAARQKKRAQTDER
jgi:hypothetical protein